MRTYVISVKRTKNYIGNHLAEENQYWEYAQYDDHAGSFSSGYPCFGSEIYAETFDSIEKAREWFYKESQYLKDNAHDWTTLAIRERVYETKEKLDFYPLCNAGVLCRTIRRLNHDPRRNR